MSTRKTCKKRKIKETVNEVIFECRRINYKMAALGGACIALLGMLSFFIGGSPTYLLHMLRMPLTMPTRWFFKLTWSIWYFLLGATFYIVCSVKERSKKLNIYRGNMLFVIMLVFNYIWYPLFFGAEAIFLALVCCAIMMILCFFTFCNYYKVNILCGIVMISHLFWLFYMFCLNATILFIN